MIKPVGDTTKKNTIPITIGAIIFPKKIPRWCHNLFKGYNNLEFKIPKIKKINDKSNAHILKSPWCFNGHKAIIKSTIKNTNPKLLLEEIFSVFENLIFMKVI